MTIVAHMCWWCGHRHKDLDIISEWNRTKFQCKDREACEDRLSHLSYEQSLRLHILGERP